MRHCLVIICLLGLSFASKAQATQTVETGPKYFAQCMLDIQDESVFFQLEADLRANPHVSVARLDWNTKRAFLVTKDLTSFSREEFESWLGEQSTNATCIQVGLHGIDPVHPYPFTNCEN